MNSLETKNLTIGYGEEPIVSELCMSIPKSEITIIIGANGCGKSTILKTIARVLKPVGGEIYMEGQEISTLSTNTVARQMAVLPQTPEAPKSITVRELVGYGRYPYQKGFGKLTKEDEDLIGWALEVTQMQEFASKPLGSLSGGQRQRAWIAMALAQQTDLILLDEPTTYLDLAHQLEILELLERLNKEEKRTVVMVLHDLNLAARFAHYMIAVKKGKIVKAGSPWEVMTKEVLAEVFQIDAQIVTEPISKRPICLTYQMLKTNEEPGSSLTK